MFRRFSPLVVALAAIICVLGAAGQASAWEFLLRGDFNWNYEYYTQTGREGFFGKNGSDATGGVSFFNAATRNFWYGIPRITSRNIASGSDAVAQYMYANLYPEVSIFQAVRLRGKYRVGGWNDARGGSATDKTNSYYLTGTAVGTEVAMAEGQWTMFWATLRTPWGLVAYGKRPKNFGLGLQYDGERTVASESLLIRTDYGPMTFGIGLYPYRQSLPARALSFNESYFDFVYPYALFSNVNKMDKSLIPQKDLEGFAIYRSGPMEMGVFAAYSEYYQGAETLPFTPLFILGGFRTSEEGTILQGTSHVKFNNGRFFFNAEASWLYGHKRQAFNISAIPNNNLAFNFGQARTYIEQWRYMVETGVFAGPTKVSLLYAFTPGLDRRNGILIDRQNSPMLRQPLLSRELSSVSMWLPYAYIMPYMYNSGLPAMVDTTSFTGLFPFVDADLGTRIDSSNKEGGMLDAQVLAARFDYAAAANLNVFGSFFYAQRVSKGYGWGCIFPLPFSAAGSDLGSGEVVVIPNYNNLSPAIPDSSLGYEVTGGVDWKLLEGWTLGFLAARWQPGKWFNYACVDRGVPDWFFGGPNNVATNYGTRPAKTIDPVWALRCSMTVEF